MKSAFKGILFDFDGTLADTMVSHFQAWEKALAEYGISIKQSDYFPLEGSGLREVAELLTEGHSLSKGDISEVVRKKKEYYVRDHQMKFYPGIEQLISELKNKKIPIAIVTAGHLDQLEGSVPSPFLSQFDVIVTGDQFERGKPYPDPYLRGAKDLKLKTTECIAIENAPIGVESVKRAGIYCVAVCTTVDRNYLSKADEIVEKVEDLKRSKTIQEMIESFNS